MPHAPIPDPDESTPAGWLVPAGAALPSAPGGRGQDAAATPGDWQRIISAVRQYRWLVAGVAALGTAVGVLATRFLRPTYAASAIVWIEVPDRYRQPNEGPIAGGQLLGASSGWLEVLHSHVVLDAVVREQRLYLRPRSAADAAALVGFDVTPAVHPGRFRVTVDDAGRGFALSDVATGLVLQYGVVGDSVGPALGVLWAPARETLRPGGVIDFSITAPNDAAVKLADELRVKQSGEGNFVRIEWRAPDPRLAAATVNGVLEHMVTVAADLKRQRLTELTSILGDQLEHARSNLARAEAALTQFRVRNATQASAGAVQGPDGRRLTPDPTLATYLDLRVTAAQLSYDRQAIEQVLAQAADSGLSADALVVIPSVQHSAELSDALKELTAKQAELRALRYRYADAHPPVRQLAAQVDSLVRRIIPRLAQGLVASLAARAAELGQRADSVSRDLRSAPPVALDELRLERDQANAAVLFSNLQQRHEEARLAEVSSLPDVRVLEHATQPNKPFINLAPLLVFFAFAGSLGLGTLGAVGLARVDSKVRNPAQVSRALGLPILGAVPHVQRNGKPRRTDDDATRAVEALRGIRLNLQHAYGAAGPLLVTVTSPGRGEGKSFVSSNLAQTFADVGYRTLLIDGDVRIGALHRPMRLQRRPGLTDILAGRLPVEQALQTAADPLLTFLGCGSRMHRGPELLASTAVPRLLTALRSQFDVILVDSAPLAAGVDPYALGTATGSMLIVLRTGVTHRGLAEAKVEVLGRLPIRLLGVVLNDVRPGAEAYSYYAYALTGTELEEEDPEGVAGDILLPGTT